MGSVVATSLYALAMLDFAHESTTSILAAGPGRRCLAEFSRRELLNVALALVMMDLAEFELLSFILERLARQRPGSLLPLELRALGIVACCVYRPSALRPEMQKAAGMDAATSGGEATQRCTGAISQIQ